ncbi:MAG TPA: terminase family protein [Terriglobia bacterium]|nr:terminase family protein [Terriglobia bacterium]
MRTQTHKPAGKRLKQPDDQGQLQERQEPSPLKAETSATGLLSVSDVKPEMKHLGFGLRAYQMRWVADPARFAIAVKSAQIGYSTATAAWAVDRCLSIPRRNVIFLSRSERQALELGEKAKAWVDGFRGIAASWSPNHAFAGTSVLQHEIRFGNGSRIIVLAANPDTARGYTGDVVLDEFAFHKDSQAIFTAVYRQVSLGFAMRILSTPNGQQGKFYELAKQLGLDSGVRPAEQPVRQKSEDRAIGPSGDRVIEPSGHRAIDRKNPKREISQSPDLVITRSPDSLQSPDHPITRSLNPWSGHWCDIFMAIEDGLPLNAEEIRGGCDDDTWLQEYCCQFISQASEWISPELFQQCVSSEATTALRIGSSSDLAIGSSQSQAPDDFNRPITRSPDQPMLYAGWDIARNRDLSVIWINELVGDVTWTRGVVEMKNTPTPDQIREARSLMPNFRRLVIDKGGMGLVIFEALEREFPGQVEGIQFTQQKKETMAVTAKRRMEELKVRLPDSNSIRQSFRSVKKSVNALGLTRFDAEHDARFGHADHWWAFCLAEAAADRPTYHLAEVGKVFGQGVITRTENWTF